MCIDALDSLMKTKHLSAFPFASSHGRVIAGQVSSVRDVELILYTIISNTLPIVIVVASLFLAV